MVMFDARHWRRMGGLVAAGAVVALSAGCTGDDPTPPTTSTTSSGSTTTTPPTTSSSPTTTSTTSGTGEIPAAAKAHTPAGAEAFVRYFNEQLGRAWMIPDSSILSPLCEPSAVACSAYQTTAKHLVSSKQRYDSSPIEISRLKSGSSQTELTRVELAGFQREARIVDLAGRTVQSAKRAAVSYVYYLHWTESRWTVQSIKVAA